MLSGGINLECAFSGDDSAMNMSGKKINLKIASSPEQTAQCCSTDANPFSKKLKPKYYDLKD